MPLMFAGGRDHEGCPTLQLTQPKPLQEEMLREMTQEGILDMLIYFTSVPRFEIGTACFHGHPIPHIPHAIQTMNSDWSVVFET